MEGGCNLRKTDMTRSPLLHPWFWQQDRHDVSAVVAQVYKTDVNMLASAMVLLALMHTGHQQISTAAAFILLINYKPGTHCSRPHLSNQPQDVC